MKRNINIKRRDLLITLTLLIALGVTAGLIRWQSEAQSPGAARPLSGEDVLNTLYAPEPGQGNENASLLSQDAYWQARYGYPTGRTDRQWLVEAAKQDKDRVRDGVPIGQVTQYPESTSPLLLDPSRWLNIGPKPQDSNTCEVCFSFGIVAGRVNDIVVVPMTPTIAFIATDGGGVWKTTNCCSPATSWTSTMDDAYISTTAIGDLKYDAASNSLYAGTGDLRFGSFSFGSAGLLKSTDLGATWQIKGADIFGNALPQPAGQFPQYDSIGKVEVDPRNSNTLIVGTKTGVYFSYNAGNDWAGPCLPDPFPNQRQDITSVLVMTNTGNITDLFVAVGSRGFSTTVQYNLAENGANGIYKATVPVSGCPTNWSLVSRPDNGWLAGSGSGNRIQVTAENDYIAGNPLGRIDMAFAASNPDYIYAEVQAIADNIGGAIQRGGMLGIWRSTDRGATWEQRTSALDLEAAQDLCGGTCVGDALNVCGDVAQNWYDQHIAVDPNDPDTIFFDNINAWRSTDGGDTVRDLTCGYSTINVPRPVHVDHHAITFFPGSSSQVLFGSDGGVYYSANANAPDPAAVTFQNLNATLNTIEFYGGDISANFATSLAPFAVAGAQDNASSAWTGDPQLGPFAWQQQIGGDGMFARIEPVLGQRVYMEAQGGALRRSENGPFGNYPLMTVATNYTADAPRLSFIFPYEIYKGVPVGTPGGGEDCPITGCEHMIGGGYRVWEHNTGASTTEQWTPISQDLTKNTLADRSFINQLSYAYRTDNFAIVGTNDGNVAIGYNLHMRPVMSATFVNVTGGNTVLPNRPVLDVALDPNVMITTTAPIGYAAVGGFDQNTPSQPGHIFRVTCSGVPICSSSTWANKSGNLPNVPINAIAVNPRFPQQVFAGSDWGVYYTNDVTAATPVWYRFSAGMPSVMIWDFSIDRGFTTLAAFTRSRGAFVWQLPSAPFVITPTPTVTGTPPTATRTATVGTRTPAVPPTYTQAPTGTATSTFTPRPTATSLPCGINSLLFEGFETGTLGVFTSTTTVGSSEQAWMPTDSVAYGGNWSAHVENNTVIADQRMEMRDAITIPVAPASAQMQFYHRFRFETVILQGTYDGGVLEYSANGGAWTDAGSLITEGQYNAVIVGPDNPLQGRQGWGGQSPGYPDFQRVTVNLNTLRGQNVKFRYRHGSDQNTGEEGWYVDNVLFTSGVPCATGTATPIPPTQTPGGPTATLVPTSLPTNTVAPSNTVVIPSATPRPPTQTPGGPTATTEPTSTPQATATVCTISFTDVPPDSTFYIWIRCLACRGIISGYSDGTFRPGNEITRGQIAKMVSNAAGFDEDPGPQIYEDVNPDNPFYRWINRLSMRGHMGGYECGLVPEEPCNPPDNRPYFRPYANATRGQLSKIVANAAGVVGDPSGLYYTDVPESNPFYVWIMRLTNIGVMSGYPCGGPGEPCDEENRPYFRPFANVTRGQASKIVSNTFYPDCQTPSRR